MTAAKEVLQAAAGLRSGSVLVLGDVIADRYQFGTPTRVSREAPVLILEHVEEATIPGGAGNAATNVASLGGSVVLIGVVGDDREAHLLGDQLEARGVSVKGLIVEPGRATTSKTRIFAGTRTRGQQVVRIDQATRSPLSRATAKGLFDAALSALDSVRAVLVSDYGYGALDVAMVRRLIVTARRRGIPVVVDSQGDLSSYRSASVLTPNLAELESWAGVQLSSPAEVESRALQLLRRTRADAVLCTRGGEGMSLVTEARSWHLPVARRAEVFDVAGAGDTVAAVLSLALAANVPLSLAAVIADAAASVVVQKLGAATCSQAEFRAAIRAMDPGLPAAAGIPG